MNRKWSRLASENMLSLTSRVVLENIGAYNYTKNGLLGVKRRSVHHKLILLVIYVWGESSTEWKVHRSQNPPEWLSLEIAHRPFSVLRKSPREYICALCILMIIFPILLKHIASETLLRLITN